MHIVCQHDESRRRQVRLSRQASASSLKLSQAPADMLGQCGSSSAKRCEHVEVTFSGWTCILRQGLEPALTRQSWLRALCFTALPAYFRSRPRTLAIKSWLTPQKIKLTNFHPRPGPRSLAIKTRPGGPYRGWGATRVWTDVRPFSGGGKGLKGIPRICGSFSRCLFLAHAPCEILTLRSTFAPGRPALESTIPP